MTSWIIISALAFLIAACPPVRFTEIPSGFHVVYGDKQLHNRQSFLSFPGAKSWRLQSNAGDLLELSEQTFTVWPFIGASVSASDSLPQALKLEELKFLADVRSSVDLGQEEIKRVWKLLPAAENSPVLDVSSLRQLLEDKYPRFPEYIDGRVIPPKSFDSPQGIHVRMYELQDAPDHAYFSAEYTDVTGAFSVYVGESTVGRISFFIEDEHYFSYDVTVYLGTRQHIFDLERSRVYDEGTDRN
ncbi:MAG: hypothetical protein AAF483_16100 [Planctomycetota bacterium]